MKSKIRFTIAFALLLITGFCYAQISIGTIEKKENKTPSVPVPEYDASTNFMNYIVFYRGISPDKRCEESEFYSRYNNIEIYYPTYTTDYKQEDCMVFKMGNTIIPQTWSDVAEKYFIIKEITYPFEKSVIYEKLLETSSNMNTTITNGMLFKLEDKETKEIFYTVEFYQPSFVITDYYTRLSTGLPKFTFVAKKDFIGTTLPIGGKEFFVDKGSEWKAELTLLRKSDMDLMGDYNESDSQDLLLMVVATRDTVKIISYLDSKDYYETFWDLFDLKENVEAEKQAKENEAKQRLARLIKLYGDSNAKNIIAGRVTIGMSKDMCQETWGTTLNRRSYTNESGTIDVWEYVGFGKLYFTNGKLSNIYRY